MLLKIDSLTIAVKIYCHCLCLIIIIIPFVQTVDFDSACQIYHFMSAAIDISGHRSSKICTLDSNAEIIGRSNVLILV